MDIQNRSILKNQSGAALLVALVMMIVITLIGLASIFSSTFEIRLSGNKRGSTNAFYAADSGIQAVAVDPQNFDLTGQYDASGKYVYPKDSSKPNPTEADIVINYVSSQSGAPKGLGMSATGSYEFMHYVIDSTGRDQIDSSLIKSACRIQEKIVRLVPSAQGGN